MAEKSHSTQEEIDQLKAKVEELEKRLSEQEKKKGKGDSTSESMEDAASQMVSETNKIIRGVMAASMEAASELADAMGSMAENETKENEKRRKNMSDRVYEAFDKALEIQRNALDRFKESYEKDKD